MLVLAREQVVRLCPMKMLMLAMEQVVLYLVVLVGFQPSGCVLDRFSCGAGNSIARRETSGIT